MLVVYFFSLLIVASIFYSAKSLNALVAFILVPTSFIAISLFEKSSDGEILIVVFSLNLIVFLGIVLNMTDDKKENDKC